MSDEAADKPEAQAVARMPHTTWRPFHDWKEARTRFKDLLVVFFGVYAAFLLNRFETDRRDATRRGQLIESLEHEVASTVKELKTSLAEGRAAMDDFDRKLAADEMPPLGVSSSNTGYSASDDATLLQAGGLELLDVDTLDQLRKINGLQRDLTETLRDNFQIELALLGNHERSDFYDPATRQLRPHYAWYPALLHNVLKRAQDLFSAEEQFLATVRAKQQRR